MDLERHLADAELRRRLLVEQPADDQRHDLTLARRKQREPLPHPVELRPTLAIRTISRDGRMDCVYEVPLAERLGEEIDGAGPNRANRGGDVAVSRQEDDGR